MRSTPFLLGRKRAGLYDLNSLQHPVHSIILLLDWFQINRLLLDVEDEKEVDANEGSSGNSEYHNTVREFRAFLSDCKDVLDEAITVKLLGRYGLSGSFDQIKWIEHVLRGRPILANVTCVNPFVF